MKDLETISDAEISEILKNKNQGRDPLRTVIRDGDGSDGFSRVAAEGSCALCSKLPCGPVSLLLMTRMDATQVLFQGVCEDCKPSTVGQSDLKIHYRASLAMEEAPQRVRFFLYDVETEIATAFGASLPK
jgi:hypothetical protein